jgi:SulP family sulfate permease
MRSLFPDLRGLTTSALLRDLGAALAITFMAVPQGVAYAMIAGLPPIVGLYASTVPTIVGSLFRSSRFVVAGPTNAVSLLVGGAVAAKSLELGLSPTIVAIQLALWVGLFQVAAGVLRLGRIVDFISQPVVLGYITGAGVLIGVGQLHHLTATEGGSGNLFQKVWVWSQGLGETAWLPVVVGFAVAAMVVGLRSIDRRIPSALLALVVVTVVHVVFGLHDMGLRQLGDISAVPSGLPAFTWSGLPNTNLISLAAATAVLSLVEASAVARTLADKTGDRLNASQEFIGQGLSNLSAGLFGGYPVGGSLSRSKLNQQAGAQSRISGILSGVAMLGVLVVAGPLVERVPVASLAGLLMVVAWDLVDRVRIRLTFKSHAGDILAFVATVLGTWILPLDKAIYLGVGISVVLFLRRSSMLEISELGPGTNGLREGALGEGFCPAVVALQIEGPLFFGAAAELRDAVDEASRRPGTRAIILRLKGTQGMDMTCLETLSKAATALHARDQHLFLVGVRPRPYKRLHDTGIADVIGPERIRQAHPRPFMGLEAALADAVTLVGDQGDTEGLQAWLAEHPGTGLAATAHD